MFFPIIKNTTTASRIFIFVLLVVFGAVFGGVLASAVVLLTHGSLSDVANLRIAQICSQMAGFVMPPLFYAALVKEKPLDYLGFRKMPVIALLGIVAMFTVLPFNSLVTEWNEGFTLPESMAGLEEYFRMVQDMADDLMKKFLDVETVGGLVTNILMIAALAAIGEELLFRSVIQPFMIRICRNVFVGILVTSVLFSAMHFEFYGFIPRIILGIMLGYMFYITGSIWSSMLMHFVNNATIVVLYYLNFNKIIELDVEKFGSSENVFMIIGSVVVTLAIFVVCRRFIKRNLKTL
ncbi:MAG: CPBP family intramembrane metalloprotease [Bacteroidales bacterium]|nr:CPBP family intramembrane metalloprotease [Bacteroidales bacterium]